MSRTLKDRKVALRFPDDDEKKSRAEDTTYRWYNMCPKWFRRMFMTRPLRHKQNQQVNEARKMPLDELEDMWLSPSESKKHIYFY